MDLILTILFLPTILLSLFIFEYSRVKLKEKKPALYKWAMRTFKLTFFFLLLYFIKTLGATRDFFPTFYEMTKADVAIIVSVSSSLFLFLFLVYKRATKK